MGGNNEYEVELYELAKRLGISKEDINKEVLRQSN